MTRSCRGCSSGEMDAVYFTAGDVDALRAARAARVLVASPRAGEALGQGVALDALVLSGEDAIERRMAARAQDEAELVVFTEGARGGSYRERSGGSGTWTAGSLPGPAGRLIRLRRLVRGGAHLRARRGPGGAGRAGAGGPLRRGVPHRPRAVRAPAQWRGALVTMLHDVHKRLAADVAPDLLTDERKRAPIRGERVPREMRCDQNARRIPQGMIGRQRLWICHVERRADASRLQQLEQRIGVDDRPARGVDEQRARA